MDDTKPEKEKSVPSDKQEEISKIGEGPNPLKGIGLDRYWGIAQLINFHKMGDGERKIIRWIIIFFIIYILFPDDIVQWIFILFDWKFL